MFGIGKRKRKTSTGNPAKPKRCVYYGRGGSRCIKSYGHRGDHYGANGDLLINAKRNG